MLRFIWDKVRKMLLVALMMAALGVVFYIMMKRAGEDAAALVGLYDIGVAILLIVLMIFYAVRDLRRWRKEFSTAAVMDDFQDSERIHPNARVGRDHLFFNNVALEYENIRAMYCTYESTTSLRGYVNRWYILYAERTDGKRFRVLLIQEKKKRDSKAEATALYSRIMDIVAEKNPQAELRYPAFQ